MEVFQDKQIKVCRLCMEVLQPGVGVLSEGSPIMKDFNDRLLQLVPNINLKATPNAVYCGKCVTTTLTAYIFNKKVSSIEVFVTEYLSEIDPEDATINPLHFYETFSMRIHSNFRKIYADANRTFRNMIPQIIRTHSKYPQCPICREKCVSRNDHFYHIKHYLKTESCPTKEDNPTRIYFYCFDCTYRANSKAQLLKHKKRHPVPNKFTKSFHCSDCSFCTKMRFRYDIHFRQSIKKDEILYCDVCSFSSCTQQDLWGHFNKSHTSCNKCGTKFSSRKASEAHEILCNFYRCRTCGLLGFLKSDYLKHLDEHSKLAAETAKNISPTTNPLKLFLHAELKPVKEVVPTTVIEYKPQTSISKVDFSQFLSEPSTSTQTYNLDFLKPCETVTSSQCLPLPEDAIFDSDLALDILDPPISDEEPPSDLNLQLEDLEESSISTTTTTTTTMEYFNITTADILGEESEMGDDLYQCITLEKGEEEASQMEPPQSQSSDTSGIGYDCKVCGYNFAEWESFNQHMLQNCGRDF